MATSCPSGVGPIARVVATAAPSPVPTAWTDYSWPRRRSRRLVIKSEAPTRAQASPPPASGRGGGAPVAARLPPGDAGGQVFGRPLGGTTLPGGVPVTEGVGQVGDGVPDGDGDSSDGGSVFFLATPPREPEQWPIIWHDVAFHEWYEYPGSFDASLLDLVSGRLPSEIVGQGLTYDTFDPIESTNS